MREKGGRADHHPKGGGCPPPFFMPTANKATGQQRVWRPTIPREETFRREQI